LDWLAGHFAEIIPKHRLEVRFTGSLGGLIALTKGEADIAGCHLWDEETHTYNAAFVRRVLPGQRVALITVAERRVGLIVPLGNPGRIHGLKDIARPEIRFVNRQPGSGTRVWLDAQLHLLDIAPSRIRGYDREEATHSAVARAIAEGQADAGLGLEAAAASFALDFVHLTAELYHLAVPDQWMGRPPMQALAHWLKGARARSILQGFRGYDASRSGAVTWVT
jgi:putative molybdopterin biosynthesis protein